MQERLQKILSTHGVASRRASEQMIKAGRVSVNGVIAMIGQSADTAADVIAIDGTPLGNAEKKVYIMLNKPRGYVTTMHDEKGRANVSELVTGSPVRVYPVGRLDLDSEGLLIMTNDGELTHYLTHPSNEKKKTYHAHVKGDVDSAIEPLGAPMTIDGYTIRPAEVRILDKTSDGALLSITIHEGRNRQIRKMCAKAGLSVERLKRVAEGGLKLGNLKIGSWRYLSEAEVAQLKGEQQRTNRK
ncbi:MAG: rRNA pseudouridine synthase [Clostridiales bacterium]|nr:rRNA pseudouridine synthase [Clostridiales bacterium]